MGKRFIDSRLKNCYSQEKVDTFFHVLNQKAEMNEMNMGKLENMFGQLENYVLDNVKKRWWKK